MKKNLSLILAIAIILSSMLGIASYADGAAAADEPALDVAYANLEFGNKVYLYIAVDYSDFGSSDGVKLKMTNNKTGETQIYSPNHKITAPTGCVVFKCTTLGPKNMGDELTFQPLKDGVPCGEAKIYSILEYALKAQVQGDEVLAEFMESMIKLGASYQKWQKHEGTYDLTKSYSLITVGGIGSLEGGAHKAIVSRGTTVTANAGDVAATWYNSADEELGTGATFEIVADGACHILRAAAE